MLRQFLSDSEVTLVPMGSVVLPTEIPGHLRQRSTSPCILFGDSVHVDPQGPDDDPYQCARLKQTDRYEY